MKSIVETRTNAVYGTVKVDNKGIRKGDDAELNIPARGSLAECGTGVEHHGITTIRLVLTHRETTLTVEPRPWNPTPRNGKTSISEAS